MNACFSSLAPVWWWRCLDNLSGGVGLTHGPFTMHHLVPTRAEACAGLPGDFFFPSPGWLFACDGDTSSVGSIMEWKLHYGLGSAAKVGPPR